MEGDHKRHRPGLSPALVRKDDVLKRDGLDPYRLAVLEGVRGRYGDEALPYLKSRMHEATREEILAWNRCMKVAPSLPELLERSLSSSVELVSPERLLKHAFEKPLKLTSLLLLFRATGHYKEDRLCLHESAPWLEDLPHSTLARYWLRHYRWLLIACQEPHQAWLLFESIRRGGRLTARLLGPGHVRLRDRELESEIRGGTDRCRPRKR